MAALQSCHLDQRRQCAGANAIAIGAEWLGADSPVLACLRLGVAIHHGDLPTPYRKEVERLLREGILRLTVPLPTLAQGLNLSATTLIFHGFKRGSDPIDITEFRNVVSRAYVDVGSEFHPPRGMEVYGRKRQGQGDGERPDPPSALDDAPGCPQIQDQADDYRDGISHRHDRQGFPGAAGEEQRRE